MAWNRPGGTMTTGPSPSRCTASPSSVCSSWRPVAASRANALSALGPRPGPLCASRRRPDLASSVARSAWAAWPAARCRTRPSPQTSTCRAVPVLTIWTRRVPFSSASRAPGSRSWAAGGARGAGGAHRPGADRVLQPPLLLAECGDRAAPVLSLGQAAGHVAGGGEVGREFLVVAGPDRGHGQGGGPPALAPAQQRPGPAGAQRRGLGQLGQLGAGRGGLGAQLRGAQGEPVRVQQVQAAAARVQQPARIGPRLAQQRLASRASASQPAARE